MKNTRKYFKKRYRRKGINFYTPPAKYVAKRKWIPFIMPRKFVTKLRYCQEFTMAPGANAITQKVWSCNGLYDPDISGTGHQPNGFDQLITLYAEYKVLWSKCYVTYIDTGASNPTPQYYSVGVCPTNAALFTTVQAFLEDAERGPATNLAITGAFAGPLDSQSDHKKFGVQQHFKHSYMPSQSGDTTGTAGANPAEQMYYVVTAASVGGNTPSTCSYLIQIEYIVEFSELLSQQTS